MAMADSLVVLFEDAHILAVLKPAGLLIQGTPDQGPTLERLVRGYLNPDEPDSVYLGTVHRLDRPVSGVVVWAKTPKAARRIAAQFAAREATKEYWTIVEGTPQGSEDEGTWRDWLLPPNAVGVARSVPAESPGAKQAITRYRRNQAGQVPEGTTWLRLWPETGRTHQIRAQCAGQGLPILGDKTYGAARAFPQGIALHARGLRLRHPILQQTLDLVAPVPSLWAEQGIRLPTTPFSGT